MEYVEGTVDTNATGLSQQPPTTVIQAPMNKFFTPQGASVLSLSNENEVPPHDDEVITALSFRTDKRMAEREQLVSSRHIAKSNSGEAKVNDLPPFFSSSFSPTCVHPQAAQENGCAFGISIDAFSPSSPPHLIPTPSPTDRKGSKNSILFFARKYSSKEEGVYNTTAVHGSSSVPTTHHIQYDTPLSRTASSMRFLNARKMLTLSHSLVSEEGPTNVAEASSLLLSSSSVSSPTSTSFATAAAHTMPSPIHNNSLVASTTTSYSNRSSTKCDVGIKKKGTINDSSFSKIIENVTVLSFFRKSESCGGSGGMCLQCGHGSSNSSKKHQQTSFLYHNRSHRCRRLAIAIVVLLLLSMGVLMLITTPPTGMMVNIGGDEKQSIDHSRRGGVREDSDSEGTFQNSEPRQRVVKGTKVDDFLNRRDDDDDYGENVDEASHDHDAFTAAKEGRPSKESPIKNTFHTKMRKLLAMIKSGVYLELSKYELPDNRNRANAEVEWQQKHLSLEDCALFEKEFGIKRCSTEAAKVENISEVVRVEGQPTMLATLDPHPHKPTLKRIDPSDPEQKGYLIVPGLLDPSIVLAAYYSEQKRLNGHSNSYMYSSSGDESCDFSSSEDESKKLNNPEHGHHDTDNDIENGQGLLEEDYTFMQNEECVRAQDEVLREHNHKNVPKKTLGSLSDTEDSRARRLSCCKQEAALPLFPLMAVEAFVEPTSEEEQGEEVANKSTTIDYLRGRESITIDIVYTYVDGSEASFLEKLDKYGMLQESTAKNNNNNYEKTKKTSKMRGVNNKISQFEVEQSPLGGRAEGSGPLTDGQTDGLLAVWEAMLRTEPSLTDLPTFAEFIEDRTYKKTNKREEKGKKVSGGGRGRESDDDGAPAYVLENNNFGHSPDITTFDGANAQIASTKSRGDTGRNSETLLSHITPHEDPFDLQETHATPSSKQEINVNRRRKEIDYENDPEEEQMKVKYFEEMKDRLQRRSRNLFKRHQDGVSGVSSKAPSARRGAGVPIRENKKVDQHDEQESRRGEGRGSQRKLLIDSDSGSGAATEHQKQLKLNMTVPDSLPSRKLSNVTASDRHRVLITKWLKSELAKIKEFRRQTLSSEQRALFSKLGKEEKIEIPLNAQTLELADSRDWLHERLKRDFLFIRNAVRDGAGVIEHLQTTKGRNRETESNNTSAQKNRSGKTRHHHLLEEVDSSRRFSHLYASSSSSANRYRDLGEFRESMRSIYRHIVLPIEKTVKEVEENEKKKHNVFISRDHVRFSNRLGTIYVVVSDKKQVPLWLKRYYVSSQEDGDISPSCAARGRRSTRRPCIQIIEHRDLFPRSAKPNSPPSLLFPTFNSNAIESVIHRIPGLSRFYLYLNNDNVIARPPSFFDFFQPVVVGDEVRFVAQSHVGYVQKFKCSHSPEFNHNGKEYRGDHENDYENYRKREIAKKKWKERLQALGDSKGELAADAEFNLEQEPTDTAEDVYLFRNTNMCVPASLQASDQEHLIYNTYLVGRVFKAGHDAHSSSASKNLTDHQNISLQYPATSTRTKKRIDRFLPFTLTNVHFPNIYDKYHVLKMVTEPTLSPVVESTRRNQMRTTDDFLIGYAYTYYSMWSSRFNEDIFTAGGSVAMEHNLETFERKFVKNEEHRSDSKEKSTVADRRGTVSEWFIRDSRGRRQLSLLQYLHIRKRGQLVEESGGRGEGTSLSSQNDHPHALLFSHLSDEILRLLQKALALTSSDHFGSSATNSNHRRLYGVLLGGGTSNTIDQYVPQTDLIELVPLPAPAVSTLPANEFSIVPSSEITLLWEESVMAAVGGGNEKANKHDDLGKLGSATSSSSRSNVEDTTPVFFNLPLVIGEAVEPAIQSDRKRNFGSRHVDSSNILPCEPSDQKTILRHRQHNEIMLTHLKIKKRIAKFGSTDNWVTDVANALVTVSGLFNQEVSPRYYFAMPTGRSSARKYLEDFKPRVGSVLSVVFNDDLPLVENVPNHLVAGNLSQLLISAACRGLSDFRLFQFIFNARGDFENILRRVNRETKSWGIHGRKKSEESDNMGKMGDQPASHRLNSLISVSQNESRGPYVPLGYTHPPSSSTLKWLEGLIEKNPRTVREVRPFTFEMDPHSGEREGKDRKSNHHSDDGSSSIRESDNGETDVDALNDEYRDFIVANFLEKFKGMCNVFSARLALESLRLGTEKAQIYFSALRGREKRRIEAGHDDTAHASVLLNVNNSTSLSNYNHFSRELKHHRSRVYAGNFIRLANRLAAGGLKIDGFHNTINPVWEGCANNSERD